MLEWFVAMIVGGAGKQYEQPVKTCMGVGESGGMLLNGIPVRSFKLHLSLEEYLVLSLRSPSG